MQALELLNGSEYHKLIYEAGPLTSTATAQDIDGILDTLYLGILSRAPTAEERQVGRAFLDPTPESAAVTVEQLGDLSWTLVTSVEFQYIH